MRSRRPAAFTIVEMLVVVSIIGLLAGLLLPAISNARDQSRVSASESNLRQLGIAHANYAGEWSDRQFTLTRDDMASYGLDEDKCNQPGPRGSVECFYNRRLAQLEPGADVFLAEPPPIVLGWSRDPGSSTDYLWTLRFNENGNETNYSALSPFTFAPIFGSDVDRLRFGWFRLPNARQFSQYLSGRFYDPIFYAPKDRFVVDMAEQANSSPHEAASILTMQDGYGWEPTAFCFSSYSLSPAALFSPDVMRSTDAGGWQDPWSLSAGLRAPAMSQARYPDLKTHMLEHHWLQDGRSGCNPLVTEPRERPYNDCQPYFFNQGETSSPVTLFYDGHVELVGANAAKLADARVRGQTQGWGLWSRDTPFGDDGYWQSRSPDSNWGAGGTSFHILTTDGIRGRDTVADGG